MRLIFSLSWKVFESPCLRKPSKISRPLWSLAEIQLRPLAALTCTVTLSWGAAAMALSEGLDFGRSDLLLLGVGEADLLFEGVDPSATWVFAPLSSPPLNAVKPTKPTTATI